MIVDSDIASYERLGSGVSVVIFLGLLILTACSAPEERSNPVGREHRLFLDVDRVSWVADGNRPLATTIWYPATPTSVESEWKLGVFKAGRNALNADMVLKPKLLPLVVLSHGTGGAAMQLSWLAERLAANGYLVAAVNHHGNTAAEEAYLPQGFMLWWERARDVSVLIDQLLIEPSFGPRIDVSRIGVAGFSLGGYTAISVAGGVTDLALWQEFCLIQPDNSICVLPPEASFSLSDLESLKENDLRVENSLSRSKHSYRDARVKAVYSIAPVLGPAFSKESLAAIEIPIRIIVGASDRQAIPQFNAEAFASGIPNSELELLPSVGHYTFLALCSVKGKLFVGNLCSDSDGVNREEIHNQVSADALSFFTNKLATVK